MTRKTPPIPALPVPIPPTPAPGGIDEKAALAVAQIAATLIARRPLLGDVEALERACELIAKARQLPATMENIQAALDSIQTIDEMNDVIDAMPGDGWWKDRDLDAEVIRKLGKKPGSLWDPAELISFDLFLKSGLVPVKSKERKRYKSKDTFNMFLEWREYGKEFLGNDLAQELFDEIDDLVRKLRLEEAASGQRNKDEGQSIVPILYEEFCAFAKKHDVKHPGLDIGRQKSKNTAAAQIGEYEDHKISAREIAEFAVLLRPWNLADAKNSRKTNENLKQGSEKRRH